jgi:arginine/ornithine N-succinyltransferase beta subunit
MSSFDFYVVQRVAQTKRVFEAFMESRNSNLAFMKEKRGVRKVAEAAAVKAVISVPLPWFSFERRRWRLAARRSRLGGSLSQLL